MKPNFYSYQLTPEFIEMIKWEPTLESYNEILGFKFNETESADHELNWQTTSRENCKYLREYITVAFGIFTYCLFGILKDNFANLIPSTDWQYITSICLTTLLTYGMWCTFSGFLYYYRFNDECIAVKRYKNEPEFNYKLVRIAGLICSIICVLLAFYLGPMVFVGAGGFALLSFQATGMKRDPFFEVIPYNSILYINYITKTDCIDIYFKAQKFDDNEKNIIIFEDISEVNMYLHGKPKQNIIDFINKKVGYEIEYSESETYESGPNFFDKAAEVETPFHRVTINRKTHEMEYSSRTGYHSHKE